MIHRRGHTFIVVFYVLHFGTNSLYHCKHKHFKTKKTFPPYDFIQYFFFLWIFFSTIQWLVYLLQSQLSYHFTKTTTLYITKSNGHIFFLHLTKIKRDIWYWYLLPLPGKILFFHDIIFDWFFSNFLELFLFHLVRNCSSSDPWAWYLSGSDQ